jgi:hypothetical protein
LEDGARKLTADTAECFTEDVTELSGINAANK